MTIATVRVIIVFELALKAIGKNFYRHVVPLAVKRQRNSSRFDYNQYKIKIYMQNINTIGVKLRLSQKTYTFSVPEETELLNIGDVVILETMRGIDYAKVAAVGSDQGRPKHLALKPILRKATAEDLQIIESNTVREAKALEICDKEVKALGLEMKLIDAEATFDGGKITFNFLSDGYVDFRELVKRLSSALHTRIELRQIGQRDEFKVLGGLGICGRPFCCATFLHDAEKVTIKMAKEQNLSLNPQKISGACGRLMCCVKYEQNVYGELIKISPKNGTRVNTPDGKGVVVDGNLISALFKVRLDDFPDAIPRTFELSQIEFNGNNKDTSKDTPKGKAPAADTKEEKKGNARGGAKSDRKSDRKNDKPKPNKPAKKISDAELFDAAMITSSTKTVPSAKASASTKTVVSAEKKEEPVKDGENSRSQRRKNYWRNKKRGQKPEGGQKPQGSVE